MSRFAIKLFHDKQRVFLSMSCLKECLAVDISKDNMTCKYKTFIVPPPKQLFHCVLVVDFHRLMNGLRKQTHLECCYTSLQNEYPTETWNTLITFATADSITILCCKLCNKKAIQANWYSFKQTLIFIVTSLIYKMQKFLIEKTLQLTLQKALL